MPEQEEVLIIQEVQCSKNNEQIEESDEKCSKLFHSLKSPCLELAALCMMTSTLMTFLIFQNLFMLNICLVTKNYSTSVCHEIVNNVNASFSKDEAELQEIFAQHKIYRSILDHTFPILFVIFGGPWSDYYGRKGVLLVTTVGTVAYAVATLIGSLYVDRLDPLWLNIISVIPRMLTGGEVAFAMGAYSYISDQTEPSRSNSITTNNNSRTVRTGLLNAAYQLGIPLGFSFGGTSLKRGLDYATSFGISGAIAGLGVLFIIVGVKNETMQDRLRKRKKFNFQEVERLEQEKKMAFWDVVNPKNNFLQVLTLPFKRRKNYGRAKIWALLAVYVFSAMPYHGEFQLMYLFVRERLSWDVGDFGEFSSYNWFIGVAGVALSMGIFSKWLQMSDPVVGFIAGISQLSGCVIYILATSGIMMYIASTVDMMNGTMIVIATSMLSKLVGGDEIGALFSLIAVLSSVIPLGMNPVYAALYGETVTSLSASFIILSASLTVPPQIIYVWFIWKEKRSKTRSRLQSRSRRSKQEHPIDVDIEPDVGIYATELPMIHTPKEQEANPNMKNGV